jgi:hypothetical protein
MKIKKPNHFGSECYLILESPKVTSPHGFINRDNNQRGCFGPQGPKAVNMKYKQSKF